MASLWFCAYQFLWCIERPIEDDFQLVYKLKCSQGVCQWSRSVSH